MSLWQKIKAFFAVKSYIQNDLKEAKMPTASGKPGWQTTEFWVTVASQAAAIWGLLKGVVPAPWNVIIPVAGAAIYAVARTIAKAVSDIQAAKAGNTPPVPAS